MWRCASHDASGFHGDRAYRGAKPPRRVAKCRSARSSRSATPSSRKQATAPANSTTRPRMPRCWRSALRAAALSAERLGSADLYVTLEPCTMCAARFPSRASAGSISAPPTKRAARWSAACASLPRRPATMSPEIYPGIAETTVGRTAARFLPGAARLTRTSTQNGLRSLRLKPLPSCALRASGGVPSGTRPRRVRRRRVGGGLPVVDRRLAQEFARLSSCPAGFLPGAVWNSAFWAAALRHVLHAAFVGTANCPSSTFPLSSAMAMSATIGES